MYGVEIGSSPMSKERFLRMIEEDPKPAVYNSVDRNMYVMSVGAQALVCGLNPDDKDIREAISAKLRR
jgi:hypothetical protein